MARRPSSVVMNARKSFFDSELVMRELSKAERAAFSKIGADVRYEARRSIKYRKKAVSKPGNPPYSHKGTLKKLLFFRYEPQARSVVIGPVAVGRAEAPSSLEFGGKSTVPPRRRRGGGRKTKARKVDVRPRPYMGPALERSQAKIPDAFAGIVEKRR